MCIFYWGLTGYLFTECIQLCCLMYLYIPRITFCILILQKESTHVEYLPKMLRFKILMQLESVDAKKVAFLFFLFINILGLGYTILVTLLIFFTTIFITLPVICQNDSEYWSRVIVLLFILFNIAINLWFVTKKKSLYQKESIHYLPDSSWSECTNCGKIPPRTHHCPLCKHCILRRDHHCFFTACCVGEENQRFFIVFCFYCGVGCFYCLYLLCQYMPMANDADSMYSLFQYLLPIAVAEWMIGYIELSLFVCILTGWLCAVSGFVSFGIFLWQLFLASVGITSHEYDMGVWNYHYNIRHNLRSVFGRWWLLNFVIPLPCLRIQDTGHSESKYL